MCRDQVYARARQWEKEKEKSYVTETKSREEEKGQNERYVNRDFSEKQTCKEQKILNGEEYFIPQNLCDAGTYYQIAC